MKIELYIDTPDISKLDLLLEFNGQEISTRYGNERNENGHYPWVFNVDPLLQNTIRIYINGLGDIQDKTTYFQVVDSVIDDINFGVVHLMNIYANPNMLELQKGASQLDSDGYIEIPFETPVWEHWVKILTNFEYEDYPLWLIK